MSVQSRSKKTQALADEQATQQFLKEYLINKNLDDLDLDEEVVPSRADEARNAVRHSDAGSGTVKHLKASGRSKEGAAVVISESVPAAQARDPLELEEERTRLVNEICCPRTRTDVRAWIEKIIAIEQTQVPEKKRKRKMRANGSESGLSGQTGYTAYTGVTGTTATALHTVGGSIAGRSHRPKSLDSDESDEPLSVKERVQDGSQWYNPDVDVGLLAESATGACSARRCTCGAPDGRVEEGGRRRRCGTIPQDCFQSSSLRCAGELHAMEECAAPGVAEAPR